MFINFDDMLNSEIGLLYMEDPMICDLPQWLKDHADRLYGEADPEAFAYLGAYIRGFISQKF